MGGHAETLRSKVSLVAWDQHCPQSCTGRQVAAGALQAGKICLGYVHRTAHVPAPFGSHRLAVHTVVGRGCGFTQLVCVDVSVVLCGVVLEGKKRNARTVVSELAGLWMQGNLPADLCPVSASPLVWQHNAWHTTI